MSEPVRQASANQLGRYQIGDEVAAGGMATVHLGRVLGPQGISRIVAIKRMHAHVARDPTARRMFLDEARLAYRIGHPNVVSTLDVVEHDDQILLVLEYVAGETLAKLLEALASAGQRMQPSVLSAIVIGALHGLHAAHEVKDDHGEPVNVIHRDVSPQNLIVGVDGVTRVLDFGIAKAKGRVQETTGIAVRGKLRYLSPEQIRRAPLGRAVDLFAAGVVLWESLTGRRLFDADDIAGVLDAVLHATIPPPSSIAEGLPAALDELVLRALSRDPAQRPQTALAFAEELQSILAPAPVAEVARTVNLWAAPELERRRDLVARLSTQGSGVSALVAASPLRVVTEFDPDRTEPEVLGSGKALASAEAPATAAPSSRLGKLWFLIAAVLSTTFALALGLWPTASDKGLAVRPSQPRATGPASAAVVYPPLPAGQPSAAASVAVSATSVLTAKKPAARAAAARPTEVARPRAKPDSGCDFPFTIGEGGVRIPKKSCFPN